MADPAVHLPDVRDGLNRVQRVMLMEIDRTLREIGRSYVPAPMLYGRVLEHVDLSEDEFRAVLDSLHTTVTAGWDQPEC
jgi:hypothetical protein